MAYSISHIGCDWIFGCGFSWEKGLNVTKYYYWIVAKDPESGKPYLVFGSDKSEEDARQRGLELLGGLDFEIKRLPTKDKDTASSFLRGKRLESSHSLKEASKRIGHEKSLRRFRRRL